MQPPYRKVSPNPEENAARTEQERLSNLEHDIYINLELSFLIKENLEKMQPIREFVLVEMDRKKAIRDFWTNAGMKMAAAGIWGAIMLIGSVMVYAFTQWIKTTKGI